ncbi:MAG: glycosyltransferase family 4 protein [Patescibacteria group bacterium]|nr:glycosyltransferase family 4 protein [Patescibacteria group bacterium]
MKRVLIFSLAYYPHVGGAEVAIKEITGRMPDIEFHMVTMRFSVAEAREEKIGNVFVHRIGNGSGKLSKFFFQFYAARKAVVLHRQNKFDGIWAMMAHSSGVPAGLFKTFHPEVKYFLTLQEGDPPEYIERLMLPVWPLFKRGFTKADAVVAESTFLGRWARRMGFTGPLEVIPNGMDADRFAQVPATGLLETIRTKIGVKEDETWLIHTGRLVYKNALDIVICALPLLPEHIHIFMIGDGPDKSALAELARELGVTARTHFHPYVPLTDIPNYLKACDVFIRPSRSEGMGNSFIEAMAAELPVIATQEGGIADFLFDAKRNPDKETTGWAVDKNSPEQIAEAVEDILAHPEQVARVKENAKKMVFEKYDWNLIAAQMRSVFDRVFENR